MSKLGKGLDRSAGGRVAWMLIERMPTRISQMLSSLVPPKRRVMTAKTGMNDTAVGIGIVV